MAFTRVAEAPYSGNAGEHIYVEFMVLSQNVQANTSLVRLQSVMVDAGWGAGSYNNSNPGANLYLNGVLANSAGGNFDTANTYNVLNSVDVTLNHDSNGYCQFTLRGLHYSGISLGNGDVSGTANLPQIIRAATLNSVSFPNDEANPVFNVTNTPTNLMNFWIEFGPIGGTAETVYIARVDVSNISSTYTMTLTTDERNVLWQKATDKTIRVRMGIRTNIDGVLTDPIFTDIDVAVINANPTFGGSLVTITDGLASTVTLTGTNTKIIPGYSKMTLTIPTTAKAAGLKHATIVKYRIWISGGTYVDVNEVIGSAVSTMFLPNSAYIIYVQAIDSRGNSTTISKTATIVAYTPPTLASFALIRSGGGTGTTITSAIAGTLWHYTFGSVMNVVTFTWKYRLSGATTWTTGGTTITPTYNVNAVTSASSFGTFSASYSYEVQLTMIDKLTSAVITGVITIAKPAIKFLGNSAIFPSSTMKIESDTGVRKPILDYACPVGQISFFANTTPPAGWLKCNGALISRTTYAELFAVLGTTVGYTSSTNFQLPDLRGEFIRGWDDARGKDTGRVFGTGQAGSLQSHTHTISLNILHSDGPEVPSSETLQCGLGVGGRRRYHDTSDATGDTENRPTNGAWLACIKYL